MNRVQEDILMHYGVKRRSGRYPWGSGDNPYQHGGDFLSRVEELQLLGKSEKEIANEMGLSTTDLRMQVRVAKHERRALQADRARSLREDGKTLDEIASILGYANDSSVRALLNENTATNKNKARATAEILKKELAEKGALAEKQLREGTASSQVIAHFLKLGSTKAQIEKELLEKQRDLAAAKTDSLKSSQHMEELYLKAVNAMKSYSGQEEDSDGEY